MEEEGGEKEERLPMEEAEENEGEKNRRKEGENLGKPFFFL